MKEEVRGILEKLASESIMNKYKSIAKNNPELNIELDKGGKVPRIFNVYRWQSRGDTLIDANSGSLCGALAYVNRTSFGHGNILVRYRVENLAGLSGEDAYQYSKRDNKINQGGSLEHTPDPEGEKISTKEKYGQSWYYMPKDGAFKYERLSEISLEELQESSYRGKGRKWIIDNILDFKYSSGNTEYKPKTEDSTTNFNHLEYWEQAAYMMAIFPGYFNL